MTTAQATRIRGGVDLALVLSMLARASKPADDRPLWQRELDTGLDPDRDDDDDQGDDEGIAAELGALTVGEAAARVLQLMEEEAARLAQDPRQLALPFNR